MQKRCLGALVLAFALALPACNRGRSDSREVAYVSVPQTFLRDRVAEVYEKVGTVKDGDRVIVLERDRRFVRVRTSTGVEGWISQRYLTSQQVYDQLEKLAKDIANDPVQGQGITRNDTNLHVEPGRDTDHIYQVGTGEKVALLKRGTAEKQGAVVPATKNTASGQKAGEKSPAAPVVEDWWLVRDSRGRVGWVLARMIDLDVPLDIAQYAEGQRIVAYFVLNEVKDGDKKVPQYLTALSEPKDGLPFDFNQIRVFTWNVKRHRYETAYRERLEGVLPITIGQENFDKEGTLPTFIVRVRDDNGNVIERKYKLNSPIVRRVLAPGEEQHAISRKTGKKK